MADLLLGRPSWDRLEYLHPTGGTKWMDGPRERMVRPGGVVVWHDFGNYGDYYDVVRAVFDEVARDDVCQIAHTQLAVYRRRD